VRVRHVIEPAEWRRMSDLVAGYAVPVLDARRRATSVPRSRTVPLGDERYA
jgi:hypothetical protein